MSASFKTTPWNCNTEKMKQEQTLYNKCVIP